MLIDLQNGQIQIVGKAGDPLPPFKEHMIRQCADRNGKLHPLTPETQLRACKVAQSEIGCPKATPLKGWMKYKQQQDSKFAAQKKKGKFPFCDPLPASWIVRFESDSCEMK
jgi:hypothetical protein